MKLLTSQIEERLAQVFSEPVSSDPIVITKFYHPLYEASWYITEFYPEEGLLFGYSTDISGAGNWRYFNLRCLEAAEIDGVWIQRDENFKEKRFSEIGLQKAAPAGAI